MKTNALTLFYQAKYTIGSSFAIIQIVKSYAKIVTSFLNH